MNSLLSPEAYRQLLSVGREEDEDDEQLIAVSEHQQQQLLSFVDWDVLDSASAARMLDQHARWSGQPSRKRPLRKPTAAPATLPPLPVPSAPVVPGCKLQSMNQPKPNLRAESPSRYESEDDNGNSEDDKPCYSSSSPQRSQALSPSKPRRLQTSSSHMSTSMSLPPLDVHVLQRRRVFLSATGTAAIGTEEIVQLQERQAQTHAPPSLYQLAVMPKRCSFDDEVALMPCHSLLYRYVPSLAAEIWREPIRDRDKLWVRDELNVILALTSASGDRTHCAMSNPLRQTKGKWRRWEAMKLHIHGSDTKADDPSVSATASPQRQREQGLPAQILIRNQGAMISATYCLVSVFGVGIYGRLYSAGLAERHGTSRFLRFEAYDPASSRVFSLVVTFSDLEWVFERRKELLVAGKKHEIIKELIALLSFKYPDGSSNEDADLREQLEYQSAGEQLPSDLAQELAIRSDPPPAIKIAEELPVLCISPDEKLNAAAQRRREREERLRLEEEERLRTLAQFMKLPRRARYRLLCQVMRVSGHKLIVSIYHFPAQIRNFMVTAYHPLSSRTFPLSVGVIEAASLSEIFTLPHRWSAEQKLAIAKSLLPMLRFNGAKKPKVTPPSPGEDYAAYRMGLGIREDRSGSPSDWLPPPAIQTQDLLHTELMNKFQIDGYRSLQLDFDRHMQQLEAADGDAIAQLETQILDAEARKVELAAQDRDLKEKIEEINSGKGVVRLSPRLSPGDQMTAAEPAKGQHHELRREYKALRAKIKDDLKARSDQVSGWKREIQRIRETQRLEREKASQRLEKAVQTLQHEALVSTRGTLPVDSGSSKRRSGLLGQNTWLARVHINPDLRFIASGACNVEGKRYRCSIFEVLHHEHTGAAGSDGASTSETTRVQQQHLDLLQVLLYDPSTSRSHRLQIARLDWVAYTKKRHDAQLLVPQFEISTSSVTERLSFLDNSIAACHESLTALGKKKKLTKKSLKARAQFILEMQNCLRERSKLFKAAPWHQMIAALGDRLSISNATDAKDDDNPSEQVSIDRCIFRTVLPIISLAGDDEAPSSSTGTEAADDSSVLHCHVRVVQELHEITFEVFEPIAGLEYALVYPESTELVKEFAVETFLEQQMHLEAIAMSLLFFANTESGKLDIRFEE